MRANHLIFQHNVHFFFFATFRHHFRWIYKKGIYLMKCEHAPNYSQRISDSALDVISSFWNYYSKQLNSNGKTMHWRKKKGVSKNEPNGIKAVWCSWSVSKMKGVQRLISNTYDIWFQWCLQNSLKMKMMRVVADVLALTMNLKELI